MRLGITGHRGLPENVARHVRTAIEDVMRGLSADDLVGVSCVADGPDAWFAESILRHGGQLEVVVPAESYRAGLPAWHRPTYDALMQRATDVHRTGLADSDAQAHMAGSEVMVGIVDELLAVWDGRPARGYGGTADVVAYARRIGVPVQVIWPDGATRD
ncbi:hypothetical protein [Streptomyces sp. 7N604]|uniref:hypothetical protein n=1 Tax=Streptomyces sp. 7N604 TaxID=3457415 RepID=UPI003FCFE749